MKLMFNRFYAKLFITEDMIHHSQKFKSSDELKLIDFSKKISCSMMNNNRHSYAKYSPSFLEDYSWCLWIHWNDIKESDFKEFLNKNKSSLEKTHSMEELNKMGEELNKMLKYQTYWERPYTNKAREILPKDVLVFYGMHIDGKYGVQPSLRNPDSKPFPVANPEPTYKAEPFPKSEASPKPEPFLKSEPLVKSEPKD